MVCACQQLLCDKQVLVYIPELTLSVLGNAFGHLLPQPVHITTSYLLYVYTFQNQLLWGLPYLTPHYMLCILC